MVPDLLWKKFPTLNFLIEADLILFAMGFLHPEHTGLLDDLGVEYDPRGNVATDSQFQTSVENVFAAGDMRRGQSLVVHAISEGRKLAKEVDQYLMGETFFTQPFIKPLYSKKRVFYAYM